MQPKTSSDSAPTQPRHVREKLRLQMVDSRRKEWRLHNPAASTLARNREYQMWLLERPEPRREDMERDDSFATFVKERRRAKEKERLRLLTERRRAERQRLQGEVPVRPSVTHDATPKRPRGRPCDPTTQQRREQRLAQKYDKEIAAAGPDAAQRERQWFAKAGAHLGGQRRLPNDGWPKDVHWWMRSAHSACVPWHRLVPPPHAICAAAAARTRACLAKASVVMVQMRATAAHQSEDEEEAQAAAQAAVVAANAAAAEAVTVAVAAASAEATYHAQQRRGRSCDDAEFNVLFEAALAVEGMADVARAHSMLAKPYLTPLPPPPAKPMQQCSTDGQCQGTTRLGHRCRVHRSSKYAVAAPLRRGERFCGHHHPDKYTGVRCAGMKKHGKGRCNVWSGSCYADAAPLRRGSPYCHHHRVRCAGLTQAGERCTVTSSSEHEHAAPLRQGERFCMHHQPSEQHQPSDVEHFELFECPDCGELFAVREDKQCPTHKCSITSDEEASDDVDDECHECGQLRGFCDCRLEMVPLHEYAQPCDSDDSDDSEADFSEDDYNVPLFNISGSDDDMPSRAGRVCYDSDFDV